MSKADGEAARLAKVMHLFVPATFIAACGDGDGPFTFDIRTVTCDACRHACNDDDEVAAPLPVGEGQQQPYQHESRSPDGDGPGMVRTDGGASQPRKCDEAVAGSEPADSHTLTAHLPVGEGQPCLTFKASEDDADCCQHCGWNEASHLEREAPVGEGQTPPEHQTVLDVLDQLVRDMRQATGDQPAAQAWAWGKYLRDLRDAVAAVVRDYESAKVWNDRLAASLGTLKKEHAALLREQDALKAEVQTLGHDLDLAMEQVTALTREPESLKAALREIVAIDLRCDECSASHRIYEIAKQALKT